MVIVPRSPPIVAGARGRADYRNRNQPSRGFRQFFSSKLNRAVSCANSFANGAATFLGINYLLLEQAVLPVYNGISSSDSSDLERTVAKIALAAATGGAACVSYPVSRLAGEHRLISRAVNKLADEAASALYAPYRLYKAFRHEEPAALGKGRRRVLKFGAAATTLAYFVLVGRTGIGSTGSEGDEGYERDAGTGLQRQQPPQQAPVQVSAQYKIPIRPEEKNFLERVLMAEIADYDPNYPAQDYKMAIQNVINVIDNRRKSDWFPNEPDFLSVLTAANQFSAVWERSNWDFYFNPNSSLRTNSIDDSDLETYARMRNWHSLPEHMKAQRMALAGKKLEFIRQVTDAYMKGEVSNIMPEEVLYYKNSDFTDQVWHNKIWQLGYLTCFFRQDSATLPPHTRHEYYAIRTGIRACA